MTTHTQRYALGVAYQGTAYHGWQSQDNLPNVQCTLQSALSKLANSPITVICAGRTDAGVHASEQVVHFDTEVVRDLRSWLMGTNAYLPPDISVQWVQPVAPNFHARLKAMSRTYRYIIYNSALRPGLLSKAVSWYYYPLNCELMEQAAQYWVGEHDFSSFRSSSCQSKTPWRLIRSIRVYRQQSLVILEITGNAFLHHMVRNMVGVLFLIGRGIKEPGWALEVLEARNRQIATVMAPADGLYLAKVIYPPQFQLPITPVGPFFLSGNLL